MKIFLDTADLDSILALSDIGAVDGVTTNPSIIAKSGNDYHKVISNIAASVSGPVSAEVLSTSRDEMIKEGRILGNISSNIIVKLPITVHGLSACKILKQENIRTNLTLCFSPSQAIMAHKAGADFVSPFIGRIDDVSNDGMRMLSDIIKIYKGYDDIETKIIAASIRHPQHILDAARMGVDIVTVPPKVIYMMIEHHMTTQGLAKFLEDWEKTLKK